MKKIKVSPDYLKIIALVSMTIDHIGLLFGGILSTIERGVGRISLPIFAFLLMNHLWRQQIFEKYMERLFLFGLLTIPSLFFFFPFLPLNMFFTFLLPVAIIYAMKKNHVQSKILRAAYFAFLFLLGAILSFYVLYSVQGYLLLMSLYFYFKKPTKIRILFLLMFSFLLNWDFSQITIDSVLGSIVCMTTVVFLLGVNMDSKYKRILRPWWIFYLYYPVHLALLCILYFFTH